MTPRAANVGFGWWSHDIGGFKPEMNKAGVPAYIDSLFHTEEPELFLRWLQFATYAPIFRTHCRSVMFNLNAHLFSDLGFTVKYK